MRINHPPVVHNITATRTPLAVDVETSLQASASDADGDTLTYQWSSTCSGRFAGGGPNPGFSLHLKPASASCTFHVVVQDGAGGQGEGDLTVPAGLPTVVETGAPVIGLVFQSTDGVGLGQTVTLGIDTQDATGSSLVYEWSATAGRFADQHDIQPECDMPGQSVITWTAPDQADCVWEVTVVVRNHNGAQTSYLFRDLRTRS
jgi:hypothetical protein